jgi:hypothetical protein
MVAAVAREVSLPAHRRTWEGRLLGIPYSFRPPTPARIRRSYWNPRDRRLFTERVFGVGWAINLARARALLDGAFRRMAGTSASPGEAPEPDLPVVPHATR